MAGKVIVGLPLHWPCTQRLQWFIHIIGKGMSLYSAHGIWAAHFTFLLSLYRVLQWHCAINTIL